MQQRNINSPEIATKNNNPIRLKSRILSEVGITTNTPVLMETINTAQNHRNRMEYTRNQFIRWNNP